MFEWKAEEMVLTNSAKTIEVPKRHTCNGIKYEKVKVYDCEDKVSREDKIAFVDSFTDGKLSYILSLCEKFDNEKTNLPQANAYGDVKTVSLIAWLQRNDKGYSRAVFSRNYNYGSFTILSSSRFIQHYNKKSAWDLYDDLVDECFHRQLINCEKMEKKYFEEHDEYCIHLSKLRDKGSHITFGVPLVFWSTGKIEIRDEQNKELTREITLEEIKELLAKHEQVEAYIEKLSQETKIRY